MVLVTAIVGRCRIDRRSVSTLPPTETTSTTFSLCTARPVSSCSVATTFLVFVSMISPVEGKACRPSRLKVIQPG